MLTPALPVSAGCVCYFACLPFLVAWRPPSGSLMLIQRMDRRRVVYPKTVLVHTWVEASAASIPTPATVRRHFILQPVAKPHCPGNYVRGGFLTTNFARSSNDRMNSSLYTIAAAKRHRHDRHEREGVRPPPHSLAHRTLQNDTYPSLLRSSPHTPA